MTESLADVLDRGAARRRERVEQITRLRAELYVLEEYDVRREREGHDYGCGQRGAELMRRRRALRGLGERDYFVEGDEAELTEAIAEARERLLRPRLERVRREDYRRETKATRRTLKVLEVMLDA